MAARLDAIAVDAGFGGIYQLYSVVKLGLFVKLIDKAHDVGGTWYWNRYPGRERHGGLCISIFLGQRGSAKLSVV